MSQDPTRYALAIAEFFVIDTVMAPVIVPARLYGTVELTSKSKEMFTLPWESTPDPESVSSAAVSSSADGESSVSERSGSRSNGGTEL